VDSGITGRPEREFEIKLKVDSATEPESDSEIRRRFKEGIREFGFSLLIETSFSFFHRKTISR